MTYKYNKLVKFPIEGIVPVNLLLFKCLNN